MTAWIHHILFDQLSLVDQLKVEAVLVPVALAVFLVCVVRIGRRAGWPGK
jgi:hypothetical protein